MEVLPETGISTTLIKGTIGADTNDIGQLCIHVNTNMFSKYKPVSFPKDCVDGFVNWWKGSAGNCGINIPIINDIKQAGVANWTYEKPRGNNYSPYREGDYRTYRHAAYPIIMSMYNKGVEVNKASGLGELSMMFFISSSSVTQLGVEDIEYPSLKDLYIYAELVDSRGIARVSVTGDTTLGNGGSHLAFSISTLDEGQYTLYLCLSDTLQTAGGAGVGGTLYALYHDPSHLTQVPVKIVSYSPISLSVDGIGYSLNGPFMEKNRLYGGDLALETDGNVTFKCTLTAKSDSQGGRYRVADMVADVNRTFFDHSYTAGLFGRVFNESKQEVLEISASAGESKTYYFSGWFLDVGQSGAAQSPPSGKRISTAISIMASIGNVTNKAFIGGSPFVAVAGRGDFIPDPGPDSGDGGDY